MFCVNCGAKLEDGKNFCPGCGKRIGTVSSGAERPGTVHSAEQHMKPVKYVSSLLTFYLKGEISAGQNMIMFREPNTILGLIPLGSKKENIPVTQIASTKSSFSMKLGKLMIGAVFTILGVLAFKLSWILGLLLLIVGANGIIDAFEIDLKAFMTSGEIKQIDFFIFDKGKAKRAEQEILAMISNRMDDTNNRYQTDRIVEAIGGRY